MPLPESYLVFTREFDALRLPYMITGGVAAIFYGEPRFTVDIDIVLDLSPGDAPRFHEAFPGGEFYCPPLETIRDEASRPSRGHFNLIHHKTGFKADLYLKGTDRLHAWGLARARRVDFRGESLALAPPEYVVLKKLQFFQEGGSSKHLRDIQRMLVALGDGWDRSVLLKLVEEHGLAAEWSRALGPAVD